MKVSWKEALLIALFVVSAFLWIVALYLAFQE